MLYLYPFLSGGEPQQFGLAANKNLYLFHFKCCSFTFPVHYHTHVTLQHDKIMNILTLNPMATDGPSFPVHRWPALTLLQVRIHKLDFGHETYVTGSSRGTFKKKNITKNEMEIPEKALMWVFFHLESNSAKIQKHFKPALTIHCFHSCVFKKNKTIIHSLMQTDLGCGDDNSAYF